MPTNPIRETTARATFVSKALEDGESWDFKDFSSTDPCSVTVHPSAGASVTVSFSNSPPPAVAAGQALFVPAGIGIAGVVSTPEGWEVGVAASALRFVCSGGTATVEIAQ